MTGSPETQPSYTFWLLPKTLGLCYKSVILVRGKKLFGLNRQQKDCCWVKQIAVWLNRLPCACMELETLFHVVFATNLFCCQLIWAVLELPKRLCSTIAKDVPFPSIVSYKRCPFSQHHTIAKDVPFPSAIPSLKMSPFPALYHTKDVSFPSTIPSRKMSLFQAPYHR